MYANYAVWGGESVGPKDDFFPVEWVAPTGRGNFFLGGGEGVGNTWHRGVDVAYPSLRLVCNEHCKLVAHEAGESILCLVGGYAFLHKLLWSVWWHWDNRTYCFIFLLYMSAKFEFGGFDCSTDPHQIWCE